MSGVATLHRAELGGTQFALARLPAIANDDAIAAFVREGQLGSYLQHPNIPRTYEIGDVEGTLFVAMEIVRGKALAEVLVEGMAAGRTIPVPLVLAILHQLCNALDYAHRLADQTGQPLGVVHGQVTPSNIIVGDDGVVRLAAFGRTSRVVTGYVAPETASLGQLDARADLFALGVVAHEMLANRPLFTEGARTLERIQTLEIPSLTALNPKVPPELDGIIRTALARDPNYRWQYAAQLRDAITALAHQYALEAGPAELATWLATPPPPPPARTFVVDSDDEATQIRAFDPEMLKLAAAANRPQDVFGMAAGHPAPAVAPTPAPASAYVPEPAPEPPPPAPLSSRFEPELGPEPTQIGAMPLITFGETPLASLVGETTPRPSGVNISFKPVATGTLADSPQQAGTTNRRKPLMIAIGVAVLVIIVIVIVATR